MREKNEANEVAAGTECGIGILDYQDYKEGDIIEIFTITEVSQTLWYLKGKKINPIDLSKLLK